MDARIKGLLIFSLALNLLFSIQYLKNRETAAPAATDTSAPADTPADATVTATPPVGPGPNINGGPGGAPTPQPESVSQNTSSNVAVGGGSALQKSLETELFPQIEGALSRRYPNMKAKGFNVDGSNFALVMEKGNSSRVAEETVRSLLTSLLESAQTRHPELKGRKPVVSFN